MQVVVLTFESCKLSLVVLDFLPIALGNVQLVAEALTLFLNLSDCGKGTFRGDTVLLVYVASLMRL